MKPMKRSSNPRPMDPCQRHQQFGPLQPMESTDIFEGLFARLLRSAGR